MKQHISTKQLEELSEKGKKKLWKWWKPQRGDIYLVHDEYEKEDGLNWSTEVYDGEDLSDRVAFPALSIGEMIEFLGGDIFVIAMDIVGKKRGKLELADALFEAVKEVLEK
ncbi:MAG TPA: hypothetical protein ENI23_17240 [bacterium]|nr:hypothetical protein [bacterium]